MGGTAAQARPTARSPGQAGKRAVGGAGALPAQPSGAAERVCKGAPASIRSPPASIRSPRPPPTPLGLSAPLAASPNPNPRSSLDPSTLSTAPLPSRLRLDLTVFSNSGRRLAAVGRPLYPLLFVFLPTFASSPVDSLSQLKSVPKPGPPSINLVDPAVLDLAGVLGAPDLVSP